MKYYIKKNKSMDKCYNMDNLKNIMLSERNQSPKTIYCYSSIDMQCLKQVIP